jgi:hypothetical protein
VDTIAGPNGVRVGGRVQIWDVATGVLHHDHTYDPTNPNRHINRVGGARGFAVAHSTSPGDAYYHFIQPEGYLVEEDLDITYKATPRVGEPPLPEIEIGHRQDRFIKRAVVSAKTTPGYAYLRETSLDLVHWFGTNTFRPLVGDISDDRFKVGAFGYGQGIFWDYIKYDFNEIYSRSVAWPQQFDRIRVVNWAPFPENADAWPGDNE